MITIWKPISSYFSGLIVGCLFAIVLVYIWIQTYIQTKLEETAIEEWIDFPALDSMLAKVDQEDKNTNIQVSLLPR
jgi:trans-aconitate methyltransferase